MTEAAATAAPAPGRAPGDTVRPVLRPRTVVDLLAGLSLLLGAVLALMVPSA
jgi:hypothetical protein